MPAEPSEGATKAKDSAEHAVIELRLATLGSSAALIAWLRRRGIEDFVEASCDFLDASEEEAGQTVASYEAGSLDLPLLLYSYDADWIAELTRELEVEFGPSLSVSSRLLADQLWQEAWQADFQALETERFCIVPAELPTGRDGGSKFLIRLLSGAIFGSGAHATTEALLLLLEQSCGAVHPDLKLLDVGTGTGVLAFAAYRLGFRQIWASDIEPEALRVAAQNQELNQIHFPLIEGSVPRDPAFFDVILCNILPPTLTHLLPELLSRLERGGRLYLAGLNAANEAPALALLAHLGLEEIASRSTRGWNARAWRKK